MDLQQLHQQLQPWLPGGEVVAGVVHALLFLVAGLVVAWVLGFFTRRAVARAFTPERATLARRVVFYGVLGLALASALNELGFQLSVLLGAAGVLTVAIGFASQTSASNLISGVFLVMERPFSVGDLVTIGTTTGEVLAVDLLSIKLRTFDNLFVRVPNETVMKAEITNLTRYPIRRIDLFVSVAYKEDLARVRQLLVHTCDASPLLLDEPRPNVLFVAFGASGVDLKLTAWAQQEGFWEAKLQLAMAVKGALDQAGIEIPFPHVSLYAGAATEALPVRTVSEPGSTPPGR